MKYDIELKARDIFVFFFYPYFYLLQTAVEFMTKVARTSVKEVSSVSTSNIIFILNFLQGKSYLVKTLYYLWPLEKIL